MTGRDAEREQMAAALWGLSSDPGVMLPADERKLTRLVEAADRIANERAAAALEAAAEDVPGLIPSTPDYLRDRAAALRASNGEGT